LSNPAVRDDLLSEKSNMAKENLIKCSFIHGFRMFSYQSLPFLGGLNNCGV
jgi:hypothetical protein